MQKIFGKNNSSNKVKWLACAVGFILLLVITAGGIYYLAEIYLYGVPAEFRVMSQYELDKALVQAVIENSNPSLVKTLIKAGANVDARCPEGANIKDFYAALILKFEKFAEVLERFESHPLDLDFTPLVFAIMLNDDLNIAKVLIKAGANVNKLCMIAGGTPLMIAIETITRPDPDNMIIPKPEAIGLLIDAGAEVNPKIVHTYTKESYAPMLLHEFMYEFNRNKNISNNISNKDILEIIKKLIKAGIDVNINDPLMRTPLGIALRDVNEKYDLDLQIQIIETLINAGADVNKKSRHVSPLMIELFRTEPNPRIVKILVNAGANVNESVHYGYEIDNDLHFLIPRVGPLQYSEGFSPLMVAVAHKPNNGNHKHTY